MKDIYEQIAELIRIELLKRGFIVDVTCTPTKDSFNVKTSSFQTVPVILKEIWIETWSVYIEEKENDKGDKYVDYHISLSVFYEHFNGGRNSTHLFNIYLRKFESWREVRIISMN